MAATKTKLVRIGNSRGVRLPKPLIAQAGLADDVELVVRGNTIVIVTRRTVRQGWAEAAQRLHQSGGDQLTDPETGTRFDDDEWRW